MGSGHVKRYDIAAVMVLAAIAAVVCANTAAYEPIHHFLEQELFVGLGSLTAGFTVEVFVNDFLMAIFFLLVGIELKYEMTVGELTNRARRCCRCLPPWAAWWFPHASMLPK